MVTFLYILHCMGFQWVQERGKDDETVSPGCEPPGVLRLGCCCYICKRFVDSQEGLLSSRGGGGGGGADILAPGLQFHYLI